MNPPIPFKAARRAPTRSSHLEQLVAAYARENGIPHARLRRTISWLVLIGALDRVRDPKTGPRFLIKGGVAMELRLGIEARATNDFDVVFSGRLANLSDALDEAFAEPYAGFTFTRGDKSAYIRDTATQRQSIKIAYLSRSWQTLTVEVARPEGRHGGEPDLVPAAISIGQFGLQSPRHVAVMALRYQIAQKMHAVTERPSGRENRRHWDLIDLLLLRDIAVDLAEVREACIEVFENRDTHYWPPELTVPQSWKDPYRIEAEKLGFTPIDVYEAAAEVSAFILEIEATSRPSDAD